MEPAKPQENMESSQGEMSQEKLIQKCRNLLAIAQKAKSARDEALEERAKLISDLDAAKTAIEKKDHQFKTCEEMLAALTDQKLKLAMDIDSLKKEKAALVNQMSDLIKEKEINDAESENLKHQNGKLLLKSEDLISELQIRERSELQLLNDIKKLHENNESVKILCSSLTEEKTALEGEMEKIREHIKEMSAERETLNRALSSKLGTNQVDLITFVSFIENSSVSCDSPSNKAPPLDPDLTRELKKDNDALQLEIVSLKDKIQRLVSELETSNVDRDQMMNNLEGVRVETKTLIENVEKLNEEVDSIKMEKDKSEESLNKIIESKNEEINRLLNDISNNKSYINELLVSVQEQNDTTQQELNRELELRKKDNENMMKQLNDLNIQKQNENAVLSSFLVKLKQGIVSVGDLNILNSRCSGSFLLNIQKLINEHSDANLEAQTGVVVQCFNECLSHLLASHKDNERSNQEIDKLNKAIKTLEGLVDSHNKDCEQLRFELEELSSDSNRLLRDLGNLRHENSLRVTEIDELIFRLKERDKTIDDLAEKNNNLEAEYDAKLMELSSKLIDSNDNLEREENKNRELEFERQLLTSQLQSGENELISVLEKLERLNSEFSNTKKELENCQLLLEGNLKERENLKLLLEESKKSHEDVNAVESKFEKALLENKSLNEKIEELNHSLTNTSAELQQTRASLSEMTSLQSRLDDLKQELIHKEAELVEANACKVALSQLEENHNTTLTELGAMKTELSSFVDVKKSLEDAKRAAEAQFCELDSTKKLVDQYATQITELESSNEQLKIKLQQDKTQELIVQSEQLKSELDSLSSNFKLKQEECEAIRESESKLSEAVQRIQYENEQLREELCQRNRVSRDELDNKIELIRKLEKELEETKELSNFNNLQLGEINRVWAGRMSTLKVNLMSLRRSLGELGRQTMELRNIFLDTVHSLNDVVTLKAESVMDRSVTEAKTELFDEMRKMNEVLKERGEAISKLEGILTETESKFEGLVIQNRELVEEQIKLKTEIKRKDDQLAANENVIKELESEVGKLREMKDSAPENDALSTSTISRAEDSMRLREVDDSIEEKYNKLRLVAVKLKKRSAELTQTLEQERSKYASEKSELTDKIQHLSSAAKNAQALQASYDKMLDELEETKKANRISSNALKELKESEESLKKRMVSLESCNANIPLMQKQSDSLQNAIKELKSELNKSEMEKKVEIMKYEETKKQCAAFEAKIEQLTQSLEQAIQQSRANNILELEINNYKKVIADINSQLNAEKQKLSTAEKECTSVNTVKSGLEEQISLFEKQVKAEESRNASLQEQVSAMREKTNASQRQIDELNSQLGDLKRELQAAKSLCEQQSLEMSALTSEFSRKEIELHCKVDTFSSHIQSLETTLATIRQELSTSNSEKEHLRAEFDNYKLRAQSTLAKQKSDTVSQGEKEAREHLEKMKKELDGARQKMENNQTEIETLNNKLSSLQLEKARSQKRFEDMTKSLQQKVTDFDTLNTKYRAFKLSSENALQNAKIEFEEREGRLKEEGRTLKNLVDALNEKIELEAQEREREALDNKIPGSSSGNNASLFDLHQPLDNLSSLQEREDGEGSESVPVISGNYRRLSNLVPLDILLNNPIDDENRIPVLQCQIEKLHSELSSYEVRVKHLASLLSEAEKDSARSSQQNDVLKEEVRRLERSLQRQPHVANDEYLKNVIFKFLILQSGDERTRLVPVLDLILKLSKDETKRLLAIAKGEKVTTWGDYLHSWTGL